MRRLIIVALAATAGLLALPGSASAAACPDNLTVAGIALTGADCQDVGNGEMLVDQPRFLSGEAVQIQGNMILSQDRGSMRQETLVVPLVTSVLTSGGTYIPFIAGQIEVGTFQVCDLFSSFTAETPEVGGQLKVENEVVVTNDRMDINQNHVNCRQSPALRVTQPALRLASKLLGLTMRSTPLFAVGSNGARFQLPDTFGLDEERGGRVFGNVSASIPLGIQKVINVGVTIEHSRNEGLRPVSLGGAFNGKKTVLPGLTFYDPAFLIDPVNRRYGGRIKVGFLKLQAGADLLLEQGALKRIGFDIGLPVPGFPIGAPPLMNIQTIGGTFVPESTTFGGKGGETITTPATVQGRTSFTAGPLVPLPTGSFSALVGDVNLTIQGPTAQLVGTLSAINRLITLGQARVLVGANPFRFEADATVVLRFPGTSVDVIKGFAFFGVTSGAFTGLGTATVVVPSIVPFIGGQTLGGFSAVISNKAAGAVITVDPPAFDPRTVGVAFKYGGGFDVINSITPFITVTPTRTLSASVSATRARRATRFRVKRARRNVAILVEGRTTPRGVRLRGPGGRVKAIALPSIQRNVRVYGVKRLRAGRYTVIGSGVTKVTVAAMQKTPFLDPRPGFGTRPRGPVTAGTPVPVCWQIKNAPKGAVVDLFEDTNGSQATGRDIATGLPAKGCHTIRTDDWEPGRHWAYGVVRVGDSPLSVRYWPIGITITDPRRLPAPTALQVTPTPDGAELRWQKVEGSTGYVVTAVPVDPQDAPTHREVVLEDEQPAATVSLRGAAKWTVSVQAVDHAGALGNASAPVVTGGTAPVVLAGTPNGTPQVGKAWAFDLETANLASLKLVQAPPGTKLDAARGLLTWTPSAAAAKAEPQLLKVEGCSADGRCVTQEWRLAAFASGFAPVGPARGFEVLESVVRPGQRVKLRAQGVDEKPTVKVDGKPVRARRRDEQTVVFRLPRRLAKGAHDVSLRIGQDLEETLSGAMVVL